MKSLLPSSLLQSLALASILAARASAQTGDSDTVCDAKCLVNLGISYEHDSYAHSPLDEFYTIPDDFDPAMKPGTLLRVEEHTDLTNYTVPSGLSMSRIMYTSESLNGTIVPVSAFVLWPYAPYEYNSNSNNNNNNNHHHHPRAANTPPSSPPPKFPLVAWAHGTSGVFPPCAPSNYRSLQYNFMTAYPLALAGFAVIATDYAGLGVTTLPHGAQSHAWLAGPAGANDVAYAIDATRSAFPQNLDADGPFVAMGHSQGGGVAWSFAERQAAHPQKGYRGAIAISPATRAVDEIERAMEVYASAGVEDGADAPVWATTVLGLQVKVIAAVTAVYPEYNDAGMSEAASGVWHGTVEKLGGCLVADSLAFATLQGEQQVRANWTRDETVQEWQGVVSPGGREFRGPLLVIVGEEDALPVDMLVEDVERTCAVRENRGQGLEMVSYGGMQHFPVIQASRGKWMGWIKERVGGGGGGENSAVGRKDAVCGKKSVVEGFNTQYTAQSIAPNWLVSWAPPAEAWKYAL